MREDFSLCQGEAPQACWRQVKGIQRRHSEKDAAELSIFGLRIVLSLRLFQLVRMGGTVRQDPWKGRPPIRHLHQTWQDALNRATTIPCTLPDAMIDWSVQLQHYS